MYLLEGHLGRGTLGTAAVQADLVLAERHTLMANAGHSHNRRLEEAGHPAVDMRLAAGQLRRALKQAVVHVSRGSLATGRDGARQRRMTSAGCWAGHGGANAEAQRATYSHGCRLQRFSAVEDVSGAGGPRACRRDCREREGAAQIGSAWVLSCGEGVSKLELRNDGAGGCAQPLDPTGL